MSCPNCRTFSTSKNLNIARGFFGTLSGLLFLSTLVIFGMNMDYANYPGSNMVLAVHSSGDTEGDFVQMPNGDGFLLDANARSKCEHNFPSGTANDVGKLEGFCEAVEDDTGKPITVLDAEGNAKKGGTAHGWTIMPPCSKTSKLTDCAPFGIDSILSGLGQATFGTLAICAVLATAHTGVELGRPENLRLTLQNTVFALNIIWGILSFSLFVWSAIAFRAMCDKIDTGLGRHVVEKETTYYGCASSFCTISYGGFMASFAASLVVYRIPDILIMFGVLGLESAYQVS